MPTINDLYSAAMSIRTQEEADACLEQCIAIYHQVWGGNHDEALKATRSNLAYYAGYYNAETRARVERLFKREHPYFGAIAEKGEPTPEKAFEMGRKLGEKLRST